MGPAPGLLAALGAIMALTLVLPLSARWVEEELEAFLLGMGALAVTASGLWSRDLAVEAATAPWKISAAVLVFGLAFRRLRGRAGRTVAALTARLGMPAFLAALVVGLGLASSVLTAIVAALVLAEAVSHLRLDRATERAVVVLACYAIGLGAALTPLGEPLAAIATARLAGPPHDAGFFFLARLLGPWVLPGLAVLGALAARAGARASATRGAGLTQDAPEDDAAVAARAAKVYAFVAGLVLLGRGVAPLVDAWIVRLPAPVLYWANLSSAALDNATLAAAEVSPALDPARLRLALMGLLVAGGILVPGNIPNIVAARKLRISGREWAKAAAPLGLALMAAYFVALSLAGR
ncbi:MAG: DUF1646 family protein [Elusimicrobia bacterium]|nr:DUF1646 family protein [Elusimicrobiota bacterium]